MRLASLVISGAVILWSCQGDDGRAAPAGSGIADDTLLVELTDDEAEQLCGLRERSYKAALPDEDAYCTAYGASGASSSAACEQAKRDCLDSNMHGRDVDEDWECDTATADDLFDSDSDCAVTIGEYEVCLDAQSQVTMDFAARASCDDPATFDGSEPPSECQAFIACRDGP